LGFLDDEGPVAIVTDMDLGQQRFHSLDGVVRMTIRTGQRHGNSQVGRDLGTAQPESRI
jgi:hypothetical protein